MIKVSVVMITYGHENYIIEAIEGVLKQQCDFQVELIIANDNSPDKTDEVIVDFLANKTLPDHIVFKYTIQEANKGMNPNFIWALEQGSGKYIAICEGDDYWTDPLKLQKQVDYLEENKDFVAVGHQRNVLEKGVLNYNFSADILYTQCIVFKNILNDNYYKFSEGVFNGDTFFIFYLKCYGKTINLGFNGAVYRYNGEGVYSSISNKRKLMHQLHTYKRIYIMVVKIGNKKIRDQVRSNIINNYSHQIYLKISLKMTVDYIKDFFYFKLYKEWEGFKNFLRIIKSILQ